MGTRGLAKRESPHLFISFILPPRRQTASWSVHKCLIILALAECQGNVLENIFDFFHLVKILETYISAATVAKF